MADNSVDARLTAMLNSANSGTKVSIPVEIDDDESAVVEQEDETDDEDDSAQPDGEDDTSEEEDTSEDPEGESDESSEADDDGDEEPTEEVDAEEPKEEEVEEETPVSPPAVDPQATIAAMQHQIALMSNLLLGQQKPAPAPSAPEHDDLPDQLIREAIFGGDPEKFKALPVDTQRRVTQVWERYSTKEARYAKNPALRYQEEIQEHVQQHVMAIVQPVLQDLQEREIDRLTQRHLAPLGDEKNPIRQRAVDIFTTLPGSKGTWPEREKVLAAAVVMARAEALSRKSDAEKKKLGAKKVQARAAGGGKLKGALPKSGNGASGKIPSMGDNESPLDYARRIQKHVKNMKKGK